MEKKLMLLTACLLPFISMGQALKKSEVQPFVLGIVDKISSRILNEERVLNIYLPEGYMENDSLRYPVIYLLDGSAEEDFIHISGLVQYNSFDWIQRVPKSIVVGIATVDRRRDFSPPTTVAAEKKQFPTSGGSDNFISFIESELQPYVNRTYRSSASSTLIGQSLGGLLASEVLLTKPHLFDRYIIVSPSIWWNNGAILQRSAAALQAHSGPLGVYIAVGKEGPSPGESFRVMESDAILLSEWLKQVDNDHLKVSFEYFPDEDHATIFHHAVDRAFGKLYQTE